MLGLELNHRHLSLIARLAEGRKDVEIVDIKDSERALVWRDGHFVEILSAGVHLLWKAVAEIRVERVNVEDVIFRHRDERAIVQSPAGKAHLDVLEVPDGMKGLLLVNGRIDRMLETGRHLVWRAAGRINGRLIDMRESMADIAGQEIMTSDKVTLRMNAVATYRVVDPRKAVESSPDYNQALYRAAQLILREAIGRRSLDDLLTDKGAVIQEMEAALRQKVVSMGLEVLTVGIRDVILPGDMKALLNKVMEARKASEAALITRREETASMRSQANTAKIFESNPTLMRLRELEVLEKVSEHASFTVVMGGQEGLKSSLTKLI